MIAALIIIPLALIAAWCGAGWAIQIMDETDGNRQKWVRS